MTSVAEHQNVRYDLLEHVGERRRFWIPGAQPSQQPFVEGRITQVDVYNGWVELDGQCWVNLRHIEMVAPAGEETA